MKVIVPSIQASKHVLNTPIAHMFARIPVNISTFIRWRGFISWVINSYHFDFHAFQHQQHQLHKLHHLTAKQQR